MIKLPIILGSLVEGNTIADISSLTVQEILSKVNFMTALFQAIGGFVLAYIVFNLVTLFLDRKKNQELIRIRLLLEKINKNLSK